MNLSWAGFRQTPGRKRNDMQAIVVRQMMKLTLSCDHRIVDGALGAKFINAIKQKLEDIELWKRLTA